jgi:hypothetical protein
MQIDPETDPSSPTRNEQHYLDKLKLTQEDLVFKRASVDPDVKCLGIIVPINVERMTQHLMAPILDRLRDMLPIYGLHLWFTAADAAGLTWKVSNFQSTPSVIWFRPSSAAHICWLSTQSRSSKRVQSQDAGSSPCRTCHTW